MKKTTETTNLITAEGYEKIKKEIEYRETTLRDSLAETLNDMRNQGDLRENDGYSMAVEQNDQNEEEIVRLKNLIKNSKIIKTKTGTKVNVGNTVTVIFNGKDEKKYQIVGENNANPLENKISYKSPIGSALMEKKVNDVVVLTTPKGDMKFEIKAID